VSPFTIPAILGNTASGVIAIETGAKGPNFGLVSACATATHCIGEAMKTIKAGEVHQLLVRIVLMCIVVDTAYDNAMSSSL
jgi:3-oxoacyl-[acyl-carrier-protein] synthase II